MVERNETEAMVYEKASAIERNLHHFQAEQSREQKDLNSIQSQVGNIEMFMIVMMVFNLLYFSFSI